MQMMFFLFYSLFPFYLDILNHFIPHLVSLKPDKNSILKSSDDILLIHVYQLQFYILVLVYIFYTLGHQTVHILLQFIQYYKIFPLVNGQIPH